MKKRIILFDQDGIYGSIMDKYLSSSESFVYLGWYRQMEELVPILKANRPDYLLIEIPEAEDLSLIEEVKRNCALTDVIILSAKDDRVSIFKALKAGANGYLIKCLDIRETVEDLSKLAHDGVALSPSVAKNIVKGFWKTNNSPLTPTETKVLKFASIGHTYTSIAKNLEMSKATAKTHLKNIYRKLNTHRKSETLERAHLEGLIN